MKKLLAVALTTSIMLTGCATADSHDKEKMAMDNAETGGGAIAQAQADLDAAIAVGAQWRIIDKATGSKAVDLNKLMGVAKEKAEAGETEEADRIAMRISETSKIAMEQQKRYAGTTPYYN